MMTYASNRDGNSIVIDAQEWEELQALVKRQRVIIEMFMKAWDEFLYYWRKPDTSGMDAAYEAAQDTTAMTGASEK